MIFRHSKLFRHILVCCLLIGPISIASAYDFSSGVFEFQQKLAKKGDPRAQYKLGNMYENGHGAKVNLDEAIKWYKKSAAQNYAAAKMRLTYLDVKKNGYKRDKHGAWLNKLKKDAAANDGESLFLLGTMYKDGFVVKKDLNKAAKLFKNASKKDVPGAESELEAVNAILYSERARREQEKKKKAEAEKARKEKEKKEKLAREKKKAAEKRKRERELAAKRNKRDRSSSSEKERLARELELEKQRLAAEKARLEAERRALAAKQAKANKQKTSSSDEKEDEPLVDKDLCKGKKARFLTTCR